MLGAFPYSRSDAVLHTDGTVLPTVARARSSWNYRMRSCHERSEQVVVSYWMNRLQRLDESLDYVVSLNEQGAVDDERVVARMTYDHPLFTLDAVAAQARLPSLNRDRLAFCGAYQGWGFHEDGCVSGVRAAASLGVTWEGAQR